MLTDVFGFAEAGSEAAITRYKSPDAVAGGVVDIYQAKGFLAGFQGRGSVHHIAFRAKDDAEQAAMAQKLIARHGLRPTEQKDRNYFRSVYFREPGGILFEIATDVPGFDVDETNETPPLWLSLGEQLNALLSASRAIAAEMAAVFDAELQPAAYHVIQWLHAFGPDLASHVAEGLAMDRSATSRLVRQLKRAGLVESRPDPTDKRGVILSLTGQGSSTMLAAIKYKGKVFRRRLDGWSEADLRLFTNLLRRFNTDTVAD